MIRLNVPYEEKDDAKRLGAKWNGYGRYWYIENDDDYSLFSAWLSEEELELLRTMPSYALSDYMALIKEQTIFTAALTQPAKIIGDVYSHYLKRNNLFLELTPKIYRMPELSSLVPCRFTKAICRSLPPISTFLPEKQQNDVNKSKNGTKAVFRITQQSHPQTAY